MNSNLWNFSTFTVVTSQCMNKNFGAPIPSCFINKQVIEQPYLKQPLESTVLMKLTSFWACLLNVVLRCAEAKVERSSQTVDQSRMLLLDHVPNGPLADVDLSSMLKTFRSFCDKMLQQFSMESMLTLS